METFLGAIKKEQKYFILKSFSGGSNKSLAIGKKFRIRYKIFDEIEEIKISKKVFLDSFYKLRPAFILIPTNYVGFLNIKIIK